MTDHPTSSRTPPIRNIAWAVLGATIVALALWWYYCKRWPTLNSFVISIDDCDKLFCDYALHFHPTAAQILNTATASFGYFYTAFFALAIHGLTTLSADHEIIAWGVIQGFSLMILYLYPPLILRSCTPFVYPTYLLLLGISVPILHNIKWGQISAMLIGASFLTLYLYQKKYIRTAALILAIASSIKYYSAVFLLFFIFMKDWRFIVAFCVFSVSIAIGIPALFLGAGRAASFQLSVLDGLPILMAFLRDSQNSQYIGAVFSRMFTSTAHAHTLFLPLQLLGGGTLLINLALIYRLLRNQIYRCDLLAFQLLSLSLPFLLQTSWPHYFAYLPFAQLLMLLISIEKLRDNHPPSHWWFGCIAIILASTSIIFSSVIFMSFFPNWISYSSKGFLFFSDAVLLLAYQYHAVIETMRSNLPPAEPIATVHRTPHQTTQK